MLMLVILLDVYLRLTVALSGPWLDFTHDKSTPANCKMSDKNKKHRKRREHFHRRHIGVIKIRKCLHLTGIRKQERNFIVTKHNYGFWNVCVNFVREYVLY